MDFRFDRADAPSLFEHSSEKGDLFDKVLETLVGRSQFAQTPDEERTGCTCPEKKGNMRQIPFGGKDLQSFCHISSPPPQQ